MNVKEDLNFLLKCKKSSGDGGLGRGRVGFGGGDVRMDKWGSGGVEPVMGGGGAWVRVDVDEEVKFL